MMERLRDILPEGVEELLRRGLRDVIRVLDHMALDAGLSAGTLALLCFLSGVAVVLTLRWMADLLASFHSGDLRRGFFATVRAMPGIRGYVASEREKTVRRIREDLRAAEGDALPPRPELPNTGLPYDRVLSLARSARAADKPLLTDGLSKVSGTTYMGEAHCAFLSDVYAAFAHTNPMHVDSYASVRRMESDVVSMTARMLGGGPGGVPTVCGAMTSGGSESILTAIRAARDHARAVRGITRPEMVVAQSAHAAFFKAASYYGIRLVVVPVGGDFRLSARAVRRRLSRNTVVVVASAPGFPHGVVDDVEGIAKIAAARGCLMHVDACLGGFVLPFAREAGMPVPPFDFSVQGVTSMSADTHKFGMAHKGTSVVLYRSPELRQHAFTAVTDWTGGLYISPGHAGSRSGGLIATAWASMMALGRAGYVDAARKMLEGTARAAAGIEDIPGLTVCGRPDATVVAWMSEDASLNIYKVNDLMSNRGWNLNALQSPPALHLCVTVSHLGTIDRLLEDLRECVMALRADPDCVKDGLAPVYGMAGKMPDRGAIGDMLVSVQSAWLDM